MKKLTLVLLLSSGLLASCGHFQVYTLSTLNRMNSTDIDLYLGWDVITKDGHVEDITAHAHKIGDTLEIVHTDSTTSKYILTAIK